MSARLPWHGDYVRTQKQQTAPHTAGLWRENMRKKVEAKKRTINTERPVLVTTEYRGVFFGYAKDTTGDVIRLRGARNCIYWSKNVGGFVGLAEKGPNAECKIGARADLDLRKITCVAEMTPAAVAAWEAAPCVS